MGRRKDNPRAGPGVSKKALAESYGVSTVTLHRWEKMGVDIRDPDAVKAHRQARRRHGTDRKPGRPARPRTEEEEALGESLEQVRLRKLKAEAEKVELGNQVKRGELIEIAQVRDDLLRIGATVKATMMRFESDLPPALEGLTAPAMQKVIRAKVDEVLRILSNDSEEAYGNGDG